MTHVSLPHITTVYCGIQEICGGKVSHLSSACDRVGVTFDQLPKSDRLRVHRVCDLEHEITSMATNC